MRKAMHKIDSIFFYHYLEKLYTQCNTINLDIESLDIEMMKRQINALKVRLENSIDNDVKVSFSDVLMQLNEVTGEEIESQSELIFSVNPNTTTNFKWKSRTASMVEKVDKLLNNTTFFVKSLQKNWDDLNAKDFFSDKSISDWTKQAAHGKKQVDIFRKEMIYNLQILDNAKNLGRLIGSSNKLFEDSPEQEAAIAEYTLNAVKTAARASQLSVISWQQSLANESFNEINNLSNEINSAKIKESTEKFLKNVTTSIESNKIIRQPVSSLKEGNNKLGYNDYITKLTDLKKQLNTQLNELRSEIEEIKEHKLSINSDIKMVSKWLQEIDPNDDLVWMHKENLEKEHTELDEKIKRKYCEIPEYEKILKYVSDNVDNFTSTETIAAGTESGYRLVSIGANISGIVKNALSENQSETAYAGQSMSIMADMSDISGAFSKLAKATKGMKNFQAGAGAVSGVVGVGPQISTFAQSIIDLKNAPEEYKNYYIGEAIVQGANLAMGATIGALTTYAAVAGTTVSKAVPVLGVLASLASAVNPAQWAAFEQQKDHINDVKTKSDIDSDTYETSAAYLTELLQDLYETDVGFYAAGTTTSVVGGVASTAVAATGVGAGVALLIAGVTAGLQGILESLKQVALNHAAEKMAEKIRDFEGGVTGFFDRSFEHSTTKELNEFLEQAQNLISSGYNSVSALGSVQMTASDLELSALTGVGGELGQTQKHFSGFIEDDELGTSRWNREEIAIDNHNGVIQRSNVNESATGNNNVLKFITPLAAAGNEQIHREEVSKNRYETTIHIENLTGWTIKDGGDNTTFDLRNIVSKARSTYDSNLIDVPLSIEANDGDDNFLLSDLTGRTNANGSGNIIDGGEGKDSATYANLQHLSEGIKVSVNRHGNIQVTKVIDGDVTVYQDTIGQYETNRGKESEMVEYRYITADKVGHKITLYDEFKNIELLAGSNLADNFNIADYNKNFLAAGLSDDDYFILKQGQTALGGEGDDKFQLINNIDTIAKTAYELPETANIIGGEGNDTIILSKQWTKKAFELGSLYFIAERTFNQNPTLKSLLLPESIQSEKGEDIAIAMLANQLSNKNWASTSFLSFSEIENVEWDISIINELMESLFDKKLESLIDLTEYDQVLRAFLNRSTLGDYNNLITYDFSDKEVNLTENLLNDFSVKQSSTSWGGSALKAVDGNKKTLYEEGSVTHTEGEGQQWWELDLGQSKDLTRIELLNRGGSSDGVHKRLNGATVKVLNEDRQVIETFAPINDADDGSLHTFHVDTTQMARYIRIEQNDKILSLAEVSVYGINSLAPTAQHSGHQIGYNIIGTKNNDKIVGSNYSDCIFAGDGNDILSGGEGTNILTGADGEDEFIFDFSKKFNDSVTLVDYSTSNKPNYLNQALSDSFIFNLGEFEINDIKVFNHKDNLSFGYGSSRITIEDFYTEGYSGSSSIGEAKQSFLFKSESCNKSFNYNELTEFISSRSNIAATKCYEVSDQISLNSKSNHHKLYLKAGESYDIDFITNNSGSCLYGLYNQDGALLFENSNFTKQFGPKINDKPIEFKPESDGLYLLKVDKASSDTIKYKFSVTAQDLSNHNSKLNTSFKGEISQSVNDRDTDDFFAFFEKGKTYDINLYGDSSNHLPLSDPYFQGIYDSNDEFLGYKNDDGGDGYNSYTRFTAEESGIYKLVTGSFSTSTAENGAYELSIIEL